ncbi:MAG: DUF4097 family beta strand repeat-containing protein [Pyrinomonadaceae bacterium]
MSWLYSIVFAGLLLSSGNETAPSSNENRIAPAPAAQVLVSDEIEKFDQTYPLNANGRLSVSNVNGSITVEAWDKNEVRLEVTKIADTKEALADVDIKIDARPDYFSVETDYRSRKLGDIRNEHKYHKLEVEFRLWVPRTALLNEIETVNGSVTVSNFVNLTKISAVNGNVSATNLRGAATLSTVNGEVAADFDRLETGSRISLSTVNGRVNLTIPSDANATIKADSLNGSITNDFGLPVRKGEYVGRDMYGRIGSGDVQIKLNSVNGGLSVAKKNDGKTPNPATNLLPQKNKSGEDWDDSDGQSMIDAHQMNRDIARSIKKSKKESSAAMAEARKEMAEARKEMIRIKPALDRLNAEILPTIEAELNSEAIKAQIQAGLAQKDMALAQLRSANWSSGPSFVEKKSNTFQVKGSPKVVINAKGCDVKVRGWDRAEVKYVLTEFAGNRSRTPASVKENQTSSGVDLTVTNNEDPMRAGFHFDSSNVRIEVFVPKKSDLKIISNGEIRLDGVSGEIDLDGGDEAINIRDVDGKLHLSAAEAQVRVIGFRGDFNSQTECGDVYLEGDFTQLSAKATDGTIFLTMPQNSNANFVSNTDIETEGFEAAEGKKWRLGSGGVSYEFNFTQGKLVVRNAVLMNSY